MGLLIMTNAQMFTFSLGRNESFTMASSWEQFPPCGIFNSWRPIFGVGLRTRNVKRTRTSVIRRRYCGSAYAMAKEESEKGEVGGGGLVLEKEFEFKPSFNDYLKTMELVKSDRETKQARKSGRNSLKDDSRGTRTPSLGKDDEDYVKLRRLEGYLDEEMVHKQLCGEGNKVTVYEGVVEGKFDQQGSVIRNSKDKLGDNRRRVEAKVKTSRVDRVEGTLRHQNSNVELKGSHLTKVKKFQRAQNRPVLLVDDKMRGSNIDIIDKHVLDKSSLEMFATKSKSFERQKDDVRSSRMCSGTVERNCTETQKATNNESQRGSGKLMNSKRINSFSLNGGDSSLEVERAAFNTFEEGNDVIDKPRAPRVEMEERIQKLARHLNGADIDVPEWMFSKMMRSAKIRFSDHSIMRVIQILGKLGNWRRVLQVIEWLQMRERFKSHRLRYIYTAALNVLGKARRPVEALNVFHAMQQQKSSYPDLVAYHCIAVTLGQAGHIRELFDVIDSMQSLPKKKFKTGTHERWDPRLEPDIVVYNAKLLNLPTDNMMFTNSKGRLEWLRPLFQPNNFHVIWTVLVSMVMKILNACVQRKHWEGAFWVLQQLKEKGQKPSASTYGLVMEVMFACGKYNLVHDFFRKVQKSFIPNALAYKVIVNTLWREGKTDEAVLAVLDMERRGIVGSAALYYDLARCLCCAGRCQEALMQIEKICKVANKPLVVTYTGLIQACLDSGHIENATFIFNEMKEFCSPNLVTCNIMLKAYLEHGLFEEADKLFKKVSEDSYRISSGSDSRGLVVPDIFTFNTMLDACVTEKRWDDFEYAYKRMLHHGFHFNAKRHLRMILNASRAGKVELLETTWKHLAQADRTPPPPLIKERFCISLQREDYISALSCITSHPVADIPEFSKMAWLNLFLENSRRFRDDTFVRLIHEASTLTMRSDSRNPALDNLISSCREFLRTHRTAPEMNVRQTLSKLVCETNS